jgi:hypothetical protein
MVRQEAVAFSAAIAAARSAAAPRQIHQSTTRRSRHPAGLGDYS